MRVLVYITIATFLPSSAGAGNLFPPAKPEPVQVAAVDSLLTSLPSDPGNAPVDEVLPDETLEAISDEAPFVGVPAPAKPLLPEARLVLASLKRDNMDGMSSVPVPAEAPVQVAQVDDMVKSVEGGDAPPATEAAISLAAAQQIESLGDAPGASRLM